MRKYKAAFMNQRYCRQNRMYFALKRSYKRIIRKKQALVKWLGYSNDFNSWIPLSSLQDLSNQ